MARKAPTKLLGHTLPNFMIFELIHLPRLLTISGSSETVMGHVAPPARRESRSISRTPGMTFGFSLRASNSFLNLLHKGEGDRLHSLSAGSSVPKTKRIILWLVNSQALMTCGTEPCLQLVDGEQDVLCVFSCVLRQNEVGATCCQNFSDSSSRASPPQLSARHPATETQP